MDERLSDWTVSGRYVARQIGNSVEKVLMYDLWMDGCMIKAPSTLREGDKLTVKLLDNFDGSGTVIWLEQGHAGVLFDERIQPVIVQHLGFPAPEISGRVATEKYGIEGEPGVFGQRVTGHKGNCD